MNLQQLSTVHKAIAAGLGVVVIGLLEYVTTSTELEAQLEQLLPASLVPVVPIILGGIGLTYHVWKAENYAPVPAAEPARLVPVSAPAAAAPVDDPAPTVAAAALPSAIVVGPPTSFVPLPKR